MDSHLEIQRQTHEEVERFERALYTLLSRPQSTHESRLQTEHKAAQVLDRISARVVALNGLYVDEESRKRELDAISATAVPNDLSEFYNRLGKIQQHYQKYPDSLPGGVNLEVDAILAEPDPEEEEEFAEEDRTSWSGLDWLFVFLGLSSSCFSFVLWRGIVWEICRPLRSSHDI
jgi:splicing factor 3A subunit 3